MKAGAGKRKGSAWERAAGVVLSLWLTGDKRPDLFARTVLSGGQFTVTDGKSGIPGDLMANHPAAFEFLALFAIEAKHYRELKLSQFLLDRSGSSFLYKVFEKHQKQSAIHGLAPFVVAKQNNYPPIALLDYHSGMAAVAVANEEFPFHIMHGYRMVVMHLENLTSKVPPDKFLQMARQRGLSH